MRLRMDAVPTLAVHPVLAVTIVTAIPVVAFALWADYYGRYIDENADKKGDEALDRPTELRRARWASIYAFLVLACIYLSTGPIRRDHSLACLLVFVVALSIQSHTQTTLERKIRGPMTATGGDYFRVFAKAMIWTLGSLFFYFSLIWGGLYIGHTILSSSAMPREFAVWVLASIGIFSIFGATSLLLALTPFHLRKMLPTTRLSADDVLRAKIEDCFTRAGFRAPDIWILELDDFRFTNAMISGFSSGRGIFKPALFLSRTMMTKLSHDELEAVILHEVSHWSLKHMRRRFVNSLIAIAASTVVLSFAFVAGQMFLAPAGQALLRIVTTLSALFIPFMLVRNQTEQHEVEADLHCVLSLGASAESFANALRKIDKLNDFDGQNRDPFTALGGGHPATEMRILRVRQALDELQKLEKTESSDQNDQGDHFNKAA